MLGLLRRNIGDDFDINTKRMLYLAFVRSQLDYASEVYGAINPLVKFVQLEEERYT